MSQPQAGADRRKDYRIPFNARVLCTHKEGAFCDYSANVSRGGVFLLSMVSLPLQTEVQLSFVLPGQPEALHVTAKVAFVVQDKKRSEVECGMGIQFTNLSDSQVAKLNCHLLNSKMAYLELKKLLSQNTPNLKEIRRQLEKIPNPGKDLLSWRYRVNRICKIFEPDIHDIEESALSKLSA